MAEKVFRIKEKKNRPKQRCAVLGRRKETCKRNGEKGETDWSHRDPRQARKEEERKRMKLKNQVPQHTLAYCSEKQITV